MIPLRGHETRKRSIVKAISWRILGSMDTFMLGWLFTGSFKAAGAIASTEVLTKMILYYLHERGWSFVNWGFLPVDAADEDGSVRTEHAKTESE